MKILITGKNGQIGWELQRAWTTEDVIALDRSALDLADPELIRRSVRDTRPDVIVNAAAYTAVDRVESDSELAKAVNGVAPGILAEEAERLGALLVHFSTDYVFDGEKRSEYLEDDEPNPINVYGVTKLAGERAVQAVGGQYLILRTSWVYGLRGRNFLLAILDRARKQLELRVVDDQIGSPTWCGSIASATARIVDTWLQCGQVNSEIFHLTASGETSWYGFAREIIARTGSNLPRLPEVSAITSDQYPTPARRPKYSILSHAKLERTFGFTLEPWPDGLKAALASPGKSEPTR